MHLPGFACKLQNFICNACGSLCVYRLCVFYVMANIYHIICLYNKPISYVFTVYDLCLLNTCE